MEVPGQGPHLVLADGVALALEARGELVKGDGAGAVHVILSKQVLCTQGVGRGGAGVRSGALPSTSYSANRAYSCRELDGVARVEL